MPRCGYLEHGLEYFLFYVQKHIAHLAADTVKLTGPQTLAEKRWVGPVKFLFIIMFDISQIRPKSLGLGGAVRFLVVGTIGQRERPPQGQLWMEQCLTSLNYWPV